MTQPHATPIVRASIAKRVLTNPLGAVAIVVLALVTLAAVFAELLAPLDPTVTDLANVLKQPGDAGILGTDSAGRDVLSRILFGARSTLISALIVVITAIVVGVPTGLIAGYYGGKFDGAANWIASALIALPAIIVLLALRASFGASILISMFAFGILLAPSFFRLTRTAVMAVRNELYVDAARVTGLSDARIISRHVLTVTRAPIIIQSAMIAGIGISIQSGLEFLGVGDPSLISWGVMLSEGFRNIFLAPHLVFWPALVISITIGAFALLGNAIRDALEDTQKVKAKKVAPSEATTAINVLSDATAKLEIQAAGDHLLSVQNLSLGYQQADGSVKAVVENVSLSIDRGEVLGIVGESGSGKTQTAFSVLGLLPQGAKILSGSVVFDGETLMSADGTKASGVVFSKIRGKRISYIPQEPMSNLDPSFKIGYQLARPLMKVMGMKKKEAFARALELLNMVGINNPERVMNLYPHEISGGMAQRVLIAGAISCEPDLIIADEPTTALDVTVQAEVLDLLRDLQQRLGTGLMLVTHNFGVVADLADRVIVMQLGKVVESGSVRDILTKPKHPYTQTLLGSMLEDKKPMTFLTQGGKAK
jgi:ABC-type dipeptide/oligopeptide/nickel transport system ATPase component/ABC-type dipeptide/oligopeptide/nickel transport system permease subunit